MFEKPIIEKVYGNQDISDAVFSVLIPTWNNLELLQIAIDSLEKNSHYKHQILIHVNEGIDGTLEWVKAKGFSYTYSAENAGVCYSMNAMAEMVQTPFIVYINDDMYLCPLWDYYLMLAVQEKGDNFFYYSSTMIEYETSSNKTILAPHDFGRSAVSFKEEALLDFVSQQQGSDWFGSCWPPSIVSTDLWRRVGGYSEEFSPGFYSDPDFAMKLWKLGVRDFKGIGKSLVYHFKSKSTQRVVKNNGRKTFAEKWGFPSSYFYKRVLRMGEPYEPTLTLRLRKDFHYLYARLKSISIRFGF